MADFVQTMKDWKRMCSAMEELHPNNSCAGCRLEGYGCPAIYEDNSHVDFRNVEKQVSAWAAEHPEPVYPTFAEWLCSIGVTISDRPFPVPNIPVYVFQVNAKMFEPIPADLAQKLGIEPKEGIT